MDRHFAQTQDCVCRNRPLTEHTAGIGRRHRGSKPTMHRRVSEAPYQTHAPTNTEKHTVTYTRRPLIRYTLKRVFIGLDPGRVQARTSRFRRYPGRR